MFAKFGINQAHFLCPGCVHAARIWSEVMEMSGFHDQHGQFQPMCPPLRLPTICIPKIDGVYDMDFVTVMEHHAKMGATGDIALQRLVITSHLPFGKLIWQQNVDECGPFKDAFPLENSDFPLPCLFPVSVFEEFKLEFRIPKPWIGLPPKGGK